MSSPQLEICDKCGMNFYSVLGETVCPSCQKKLHHIFEEPKPIPEEV